MLITILYYLKTWITQHYFYHLKRKAFPIKKTTVYITTYVNKESSLCRIHSILNR
ncbi:uncharacterized protein B0P05DRAFT_546004 [Gilbertella persicaria]|uniref:uncharacterized protein n=1 Tax=Gilbertella persicaria TaxID=101096 RepID=UPI002220451F|nr:uncharacterized protein B0P05DRAFT_546004 [Gilbertella persicaria]KAI8076473.1 hypothetical protein B0P05DRAFT_546004 [Gilbertella persicaria]